MQVKSQALYRYVTQVLGDTQRPTNVCKVMEGKGSPYPQDNNNTVFHGALKIVHDIFILGLKRPQTLPDILVHVHKFLLRPFLLLIGLWTRQNFYFGKKLKISIYYSFLS